MKQPQKEKTPADGQSRLPMLTTLGSHGMCHGDNVDISKPRWQKLLNLLTRPRITIVGEVTGNTFSLQERRMSWREWRLAIRAAIFG